MPRSRFLVLVSICAVVFGLVPATSAQAALAAPSAPRDVTAVPGDSSATVSWQPPASNGGSGILTYTVTSSPGGRTCTAVAGLSTTCVVPLLNNGTSYTFTVTASSLTGTSPASAASNAVTPTSGAPSLRAPDAPTNATAVAGDSMVVASWQRPASDGGSVILTYTATARPGGQSCTTVGLLATSCAIPGLTNGQSYAVDVVATNLIGTSAASQPSSPVSPVAAPPIFTPPSPPTDVHATAGNQSARVTWFAPNDTGTGPVLGYTVTANPGGHTCGELVLTDLNCTVYGLDNGTAYTFTVTATSLSGTSQPSAPSTAVTPTEAAPPATAPTAPTSVQAAAGDGFANVEWDAPGSDGGSPVIAYTATSSPGGHTCVAVAALATNCTVLGLDNGTAYTFTVTATNLNGTSASSAPSGPVTPSPTSPPATAPSAPSEVTAVPGASIAMVSWHASANDGGSPVLAYTVTSSPGNQTCTAIALLGTSCIVPGLSNGTAYTFTVTATNAVGTSAASDPSDPVTPSAPQASPPGAPTNVVATAGNASASVSWQPPADDGGSPLLAYVVTSSPGDHICLAVATASPGCTVFGLDNGTAYTFTVTASNVIGTSLPSEPSSPVTPTDGAPVVTAPSAPVSVTATAGDTKALVDWDAPTDDGGSPVLGYTATSDPGNQTCVVLALVDTSCYVTGLHNGTSYTFTVTARNIAGTSAPSSASDPVTPTNGIPTPRAPGAPTAVVAQRGNHTATVTWAAPADAGSKPVTGYTVTSTPGGRTCTTASTSCAPDGLTNGRKYTFTVVATNEVGDGPASAASNEVTPAGAPLAVRKVRTRAGNHLARVSWTAANANGAPVGSYVITARPGAHTMVVGSTARSVNLRQLANGTRYRISVAATNSVGRGPATAGKPVVPAGRPGKARYVRASARVDAAVVRWSPAAPRGAHIVRYKVIPSHGKVRTVPGSKHLLRVTGLRSGQRYSFRVVAVNRFGSSGRSAASNSVVVR